MRSKLITMAILIFALMTGITSANPGVEILPPVGDANVTADGTIIVPIGQDSFTSVGLSVNYTGFHPNESYSINITRDSDNSDVWNKTGNLGNASSALIEVHWVPIDNQSYTIFASGYNQIGKRIYTQSAVAPIMPVPELSTGVLLSAGLIGILGLVRLKRKE